MCEYMCVKHKKSKKCTVTSLKTLISPQSLRKIITYSVNSTHFVVVLFLRYGSNILYILLLLY